MRVNKQLLGGLVFVCVLVALAGAALWLRAPAKRLLGSKLADLLDPGAEQRFSLIGQRESAVRSREVWDKPTLVMFGFTRCGKPCSETLDIVSRTIVDLGSRADAVSFVFISVDPGHDSAPVLRRYLAGYHPRILGLRGSRSAVMTLAWTYFGRPTLTATDFDVHAADRFHKVVLLSKGRPAPTVIDAHALAIGGAGKLMELFGND
jgi:cytochrome oxidase Cu insertion factor (SCO1/SenC/PrrC family)